MLFALGDLVPRQHLDSYVAHNATVVGDVEIQCDASVWFNAVIRADMDKITIGEKSNIQDGAVLHVDEGSPLTIGKGVTVGHKAMVHGCTIGDYSLIGINAVVLDGATIGDHCMVAANSLVPAGMVVPAGSLVMGSPAKIKRQLTEKDIEYLHKGADFYVENGRRFKSQLQAVE